MLLSLRGKVSIPSETRDKSYLKKASDLVSKCDNKGIACRVITPYGFDNLAKRGEAQAFVNQCVIRTWPYKNVSHPGHAALSIKNGENEEYSHSYVSWWASDESESGVANTKSGTKGELLNRVYGYSQINYLQDKYCEMSDRARGKLAAAKNALERIKSYLLVTSPHPLSFGRCGGGLVVLPSLSIRPAIQVCLCVLNHTSHLLWQRYGEAKTV